MGGGGARGRSDSHIPPRYTHKYPCKICLEPPSPSSRFVKADCLGDSVEAVLPYMGESVTDGTLANFLRSMHLCVYLRFKCVNVYATSMLSAAEPGDKVEADEVIAQIETDKCALAFYHHLKPLGNSYTKHPSQT
ncbi:hypothetical protein QYE76_006317 [Lolium multiflorum]|uniref:Lipoyl-binding domain-containing protein n=1 Tax=Lolium multiflorum TaxID=4521 RepID=A0AAD8RW46_LOLMU|nr:hypothetical protein QYE76_006317 [Lolium multiflorum]